MPFTAYPMPPHDPVLDRVAAALDPVLGALGFAPGQLGANEGRAQVLFCRGLVDSTDGACVDLVVDLEPTPDWRVVDVRYWGFPSDRWHLPVLTDGDLAMQLDDLARMLPATLA